MKRKTIIGIVLLLVLTAWFWPEDNKHAVSIEFSGSSASDPEVVTFTITNRSADDLVIKLGIRTFPSNGHWEELDLNLYQPSALPPHGAVTCSDKIYATRQGTHWRLAVGYTLKPVDSPFHRARWKLRESVHSLGWERLGRWILPGEKWRHAYGPEMFGNKPVEKNNAG